MKPDISIGIVFGALALGGILAIINVLARILTNKDVVLDAALAIVEVARSVVGYCI